jgi:predicted ArsR family transcriptional regulator
VTVQNWRERLLGSTRGRVITLLRRTERTVSELADELGLTANAVRVHLSALERDGLVEACGSRREWTGKPAVLYRSAASAEMLFPKAYAAVLGAVLEELNDVHGRTRTEAVLRGAGMRLGAAAVSGKAELGARVDHAAEVLTELGGLVEVQARSGGWRLQGYSCPLGALVPGHPQACVLAESLVSALVGVQVRECCERGQRPRCAFEVPAA